MSKSAPEATLSGEVTVTISNGRASSIGAKRVCVELPHAELKSVLLNINPAVWIGHLPKEVTGMPVDITFTISNAAAASPMDATMFGASTDMWTFGP